MSLPHALPESGRGPKQGTSCFSSLINDPRARIPSCVFHLFYFSRSALWLPPYQRISRSALADQDVDSFVCRHSWFPGVCHTTCSSLIAFGTGMMMLTLRFDWNPLLMWSLYDFRQLPQDADGLNESFEEREIWSSIGVSHELRIIVGSFIAGAISVAILMHFTHQWAIWLITANLFLIMSYYAVRVKQLIRRQTPIKQDLG